MHFMIKKLSFLTLILVMLLIGTASAAVKPKVLVIESYHLEYEWNKNCERGLVSVLKDDADMHYFRMDTKRISPDLYEHRAELAWQEYERIQPDVVVLADDNALSLLGPRFLKTETPVVYLGINNNPRHYIPINKNITGVLERPLYKRSITFLRKILHIEKGKILILLDTGTTSQVLVDSVFEGNSIATVGGTQVHIQHVATYNGWKKIVKKAGDDGYSAIILGLFQTIVDDKNNNITSEDILAWTSKNSPVPIFGFWEMNVGKDKTIGGLVLSGEVQGSTAGEMVLKILNGVPVKKIKPVIPSQGVFVFSKTELKKWKIILPRNIRDVTTFVE